MKLALFAAGLALVAALTAAAAALRSVSRIWLRHWVDERLGGERAGTMSVEGVHQLLLAASTAVALVAFATGTVVGSTWGDEPFTLFERLAISALLVLVVGQLVPRAVGRRWATALVPVVVPGLRAIDALLTPLVAAARGLAAVVRPATARVSSPDVAERDALEDLLREGELEGVGDAGESAIISGVAEFTEKRARDVMTPRSDIFAIDRAVPMDEIARQIAQVKYTRVPITNGSIDRVLGMLHAFDVLKVEDGPLPALRPVMTARDTTLASELLFRMLREGVYLAIIQDAASQTVGLVTIEDFLEELVGDIHDEHDEPPPLPVSA
jgi:putative hemolysin